MIPRTDEWLGYLIKRVQQALVLKLDQRLRNLGVTTPQYAALAMLEQYPGASNAELAERCFVTPQTMHQIVGRLEQRTLLSRQPHPEHGKIRQTQLTSEGAKLLQQAHVEVLAVETQMVRHLSEGDRQRAEVLLKTCLAALQNAD